MTRVAVLRDPTMTAGIGQFAAIQTVAPLFGVELSPVDVRDVAEIERGVVAQTEEGESVSRRVTMHRENMAAVRQ